MAATSANANATGDLGDVLGVLRRRFPVIVLAVVLCAAIALLYASSQAKTYQAKATLLFRDSNVSQLVTGVATGTTTTPEREAATNLGLLSLNDVAAQTARRLGHGWTAAQVQSHVSAAANGQSDLVTVTATAPGPAAAQQLADAYAATFVAMRRQTARDQIDRARRQVVDELNQPHLASSRRKQLNRDADNLRLLASVQDGSVQLVQPALAPTAAASPKPRRSALIGGLIGLLIGTALAFVLEQVDTRLRRPRDAERAFGLPLLAAVGRSAGLRRGELDPDALPPADADAFRRLRANLRHLRSDDQVRTVVVTSAESDSGKTTVAAHLAAAAAAARVPTLLIEADTRSPGLHRLLDAPQADGLVPLLRGEETELRDAVIRVPLNGDPDEAFDALVAGAPDRSAADLLDTARMRDLLAEARRDYELVILDVPPVTVAADAIPLLRQVDGVVVVARLGRDSKDDAQQLAAVLSNLGVKPLGVVTTFARRRDSAPDGHR
jgi:capsular exopolysaccharide synthesis family protein